MSLILTEDQKMLQASAKRFLEENAPVSTLRTLRDNGNKEGHAPVLWQQMVDMGWTGMVTPEEFGGLDFGYVGVGMLIEEMGKTLTVSPLLSSAVMAATAIERGGSHAQKEKLLPAIASGEMKIGIAVDEGNWHDPEQIQLTAVASGENYVLNGTKCFVQDGVCGESVLVAARSEAGSIVLCLVDRNANGVTETSELHIDSRRTSTLVLKDVTVSADSMLLDADESVNLLECVLDVGRICLASELLGLSQEVFDRTMVYLKERKQFGVLIGTFQALQHRAAKVFAELEVCRSLVLKALTALDSDEDVRELASQAKAMAGELGRLATNEAVQMHGGIAMTDEFEIGLFMKRAQVARRTFGDADYHYDRIAVLNNY